ncbi:stage III sporulation protein AA [Paenibacillus crassostreae]|uniref:Stage III sporulation protein AA n=1 Tax=Paenibacillus crassostreae TaxID=1763538 RepID=A0A162KV03_9BACL|nr:stage III sporulation protein AA [Paenibacillus crassostreae]AOZ91468.1 stage III sporulation protein AA [Paenibacillus crassostreae]OAB74373.1 stage III sporulation protein AA [Paenibacillus crassostreae]
MKLNWLELFPEPIKSLLEQLPTSILDRLEEVRIREGRPLEINAAGEHHFVTLGGKLTYRVEESYKPIREDSHRLLDRISNHSLYTMEEELRKGFITIPGGHRIGLAGRTVLSGGKVEHLRDISGFNIRIAKEIRGAADGILPHMLDKKEKRIKHALILSPPQHGKTTLIRDMARQISNGRYGNANVKWSGMKVGIIDERSEIAGSIRGVPSFDVGARTDVMDGCPKAEGMMMMIRSMSPEVLLVDEIGRTEDAVAITEALHAGISVIATAHGSSIDELSQRPALASLIENQMFETYIILNRIAGNMNYHIFDRQQRSIQLSLPNQKGVDVYG